MVLDLICRYWHTECATLVLLMFECCLDILHGSLGILVSLTSLDLGSIGCLVVLNRTPSNQ